ncbi:cytochrome c biogenesis CcdA family protein [Deinococcus radiodurans]|jgi:Cytochrome c biogenesis protein|uniref:Cytochrome c-type biogenesis protein, putative n=1 Tax=Deinococcus radiodurans (strain ATCC 13939 / DSM 20539 / JCM 16871 / CCUG 27074 / LMG 4051 / NBRC 15346 / NCIMB 9279 / VKM B-1422 / R1) TaxID=243230 RepID=Q9RUT2_DEIRA|nr:cytochrome c biogenesis CcdA family protein [Deinococcus radiodurans]AAF10871.1 cytochrome c-type biogenesis protein, putative [Deinococcus radiodurans R1 = ATCC 13939 = DSM 20539]ANC71541.1 cytochrome C biogenesis protein CcmH [Deinococcus radiodurans R1 = ATCC 13939 = DSM 20539]QEM70769.1 cytochrome c biogenesis protein CcdA [Deinococcus radiodurans]QIP29346.1 cytochrome c biogenesis protein CcdA [Deinococcus radiodurans]QIP31958.1 cytochrome c biogenesis protein CcdA [Deinococcus radiodu
MLPGVNVSAAPSLTVAFLAGLISFLSPCVLPLLPSYLGVLGGAKAPLGRALGFIAGFGLVFVALGATASTLGAFLAPHKLLLGQLAAVLIVFFGLVMLGVIRLPFLMRDTRQLADAGGYGPVALGAAFAFGWSPCLGPTLGSILGLAASSASLGSGVRLLVAYTLGLALPFLLAALLWDRLNLRRLNRYAGIFEKVGGAVLVIVGVMMLTGQFTRLATFFFSVMPEWLKV